MQASINIVKLWEDDDMVEFRVRVSDGEALFSNEVYVKHVTLRAIVAGLQAFNDGVPAGMYDLRFGEFGPQLGLGAFHARMHCNYGGQILMTVKMQSEYGNFAGESVAREMLLYLVSSPASMDSFIRGLRAISDHERDDAELEAMG